MMENNLLLVSQLADGRTIGVFLQSSSGVYPDRTMD